MTSLPQSEHSDTVERLTATIQCLHHVVYKCWTACLILSLFLTKHHLGRYRKRLNLTIYRHDTVLQMQKVQNEAVCASFFTERNTARPEMSTY